MSVYKKLQEVQNATRKLAPDASGQTGAATYPYVSGSKLLGCIRPVMDRVGLILTQEVIGCDNTPMSYATRSGEKTEMFTTLHIRFTWVDTEDESKMVNEFYANGMNAWDKGLGSALTYAERYYLMKLFHIATDEDDVDALIKEEAVAPVPAPAPVPEKPARKKKTPEEQYKAMIDKFIKGELSKDGKDYKTAWIENTKPTEAQIAKWDLDVNMRLRELYPNGQATNK